MAARTAVITGAGKGIGARIAEAFSVDGYAVVLAGRDVEALEATAQTLPGESLVVRTDVTCEPDSEALVAAAIDRFGAIDAFIANSGIAGPTKPLWEVSTAEWDETFDVNVRGVFFGARAVAPHLIERGRGSIVVIGSISGKRPLPRRTPYTASKLALVGLVRTLALELGEHGVRVNLVSPGPVSGERIDRVIAAQAEALDKPAEKVAAMTFGGSATGTAVDPEQVAAAALWLASDAASGTTGEDLNVSNGLVMY